jgi:hypothetical protein
MEAAGGLCYCRSQDSKPKILVCDWMHAYQPMRNLKMKLWHFIAAAISTLITVPFTLIALPFVSAVCASFVIYPCSALLLKLVDEWSSKWAL